MFENTMSSTWAEINLDNIKFNLNNIKNKLKEDIKVCCVVKANAYGHGAVEVSKFLEREKVDYLAVSRLEEGIELRQNNISTNILCLGYIPMSGMKAAIENNITITVYSLEMAIEINNIAIQLNKKSTIHIKIDTGMSRLGFQVCDESVKEIVSISNLENINIEGIFTHFAKADELERKYTYSQYDKFKYILNELNKFNVKIPIKHVSNSAAIMEYPELELNMVRCGIILYGHYPSDEVNKDNLEIKPAMKLKSRVSNIKYLQPNIGVSYGWKYITNKYEKIATIPVGYADGFSRMQKNAKVYIKGLSFNVIGRICMDQCMIKIDKDVDIKIGDEVILFGEGNATVESIANDLETINYEVLCMISRRIERIYMERNAVLHSTNYLVK